MKVIVCLDDRKGMMFNHRRLSRDELVIHDIMEIVDQETISMNAYSYSMFQNVDKGNCKVSDSFLQTQSEYYFVEDDDLSAYYEDIEELIIYWWNRKYPYDLALAINIEAYQLCESEIFVGQSHEKITKERYCR